ncbi:MAG: WhiB family transcriptional regulator [Egibacteraceae bacterium]
MRDACLDWAVARGEVGIWGGTDEEARARIRQRGHRPPRYGTQA